MKKTIIALALLLPLALHHAASAQQTSKAERIESGNRISENLPAIPAELLEKLNQYQNTRGASFQGWLDGSSMLIATRFGDTAQIHRLQTPMGMREQMTFYKEPVSGASIQPLEAGQGFLFSKDVGGNEFYQLHYYDLKTRQVRMLTDGKSRNQGGLWSQDGSQMAYSSTLRNGKDTDIWVRGLNGEAKLIVKEGGSWGASDFSPDGKKLLVSQYISANDSRPGEVNIASGKLEMFPIDGGKAAFSDFQYARNGKGVFFISDEESEFQHLRFHDLSTNKKTIISKDIPWDVEGFAQSKDGKSIAFGTNEDGISTLRVIDTARYKTRTLPKLPIGVIGGLDFSPNGQKIALSINSATSPNDIYVINLKSSQLTRWTQSEVGGLDSNTFIAPSLIRYKSFDGKEIPAFLYRPEGKGPFPVVINIHGGPEAQAQPNFNPGIQYMLREMKMAVLVPNVRGSSGYGKTYLQLDNGFKRKDSVKDIGALLDWIATQPSLDKDRVGVSGGSYGGYMVLASMVDYNKRIRAGIDVVGISNFTTFLTNTESYRRDLRRAEYGDERDPKMRAFHEEIAPLNNAKAISRPLFVAQGFNDPRVPYTEAEQMVEAVRGNGGDVWYLMFKDEGHGFAKKTNSDYFGAASMLFWERYLLNK
jgi:dipeptidyl aminopeptidase/acylaminoacyl peptidase